MASNVWPLPFAVSTNYQFSIELAKCLHKKSIVTYFKLHFARRWSQTNASDQVTFKPQTG